MHASQSCNHAISANQRQSLVRPDGAPSLLSIDRYFRHLRQLLCTHPPGTHESVAGGVQREDR
eukprot:2677430-Prymnesium_polylepis.1